LEREGKREREREGGREEEGERERVNQSFDFNWMLLV
jgi:hypothetical protein